MARKKALAEATYCSGPGVSSCRCRFLVRGSPYPDSWTRPPSHFDIEQTSHLKSTHPKQRAFHPRRPVLGSRPPVAPVPMAGPRTRFLVRHLGRAVLMERNCGKKQSSGKGSRRKKYQRRPSSATGDRLTLEFFSFSSLILASAAALICLCCFSDHQLSLFRACPRVSSSSSPVPSTPRAKP